MKYFKFTGGGMMIDGAGRHLSAVERQMYKQAFAAKDAKRIKYFEDKITRGLESDHRNLQAANERKAELTGRDQRDGSNLLES